METRYYTDYPFTALGDESGKQAPVREVRLVSYDQDKYVVVMVEGRREEIKSGYIWTKPVPYAEKDACPMDDIRALPLTEYPAA